MTPPDDLVSAASVPTQREQEIAANRARMPQTRATVEKFRDAFGAGLRLVWAEEGDQKFGKRPAPQRSMNADEWQHYVSTGELPGGLTIADLEEPKGV